ncbi:MAG TPA: hypothetical protein VMS98_00730 [Thermoanaerobaculia bacterium]|nr:hypothetical protein [Thermoanaerobaculia bacterium]
MTCRARRARWCSYAVAIDAGESPADVAVLAAYLSTVGLAGCDVLIVDGSPPEQFEANGRVLRWVGRHVPAQPRHRRAGGQVDLVRAAVDLAACEKVIVAGSDTRCTADDITMLCALLEKHEVVEPDEYVSPTSWWSGIDAGRILLHRGIEQPGQVLSTFALRCSAYRPLLEYEERSGDPEARRFLSQGTDLYGARGLFIRREPPQLDRWWRRRALEAAADFVLPLKTAFFAMLLPLVLLAALVGGVEAAAGCAGIIGFASVLLAAKGRAGAGKFFPLHTCLFAPLWVAERSVSVYWALIDRWRGARTPVAAPLTDRAGPKGVVVPGNR